MKTKRQISLERAQELKTRIDDYLEAKKTIPKGLEQTDIIESRKKRILKIFGANEENWNDWHWQLKNRITDLETLKRFLDLFFVHREAR